MVKREAKGSPSMGPVQLKHPRLLKPSKAFNNCVSNEIDNLIEEVESMINRKESKLPQKRLKPGSLIPFLSTRHLPKWSFPSNEDPPLVSRPQPDGTVPKPPELTAIQLDSDDITPAIVYNIPCSNRFLPLDPSSDPGSLHLNSRPPDHLSPAVASQKELISLVLGLQEEVKDLKQALSEVLSILRANSPIGALETAITRVRPSATTSSS
ncbi:hypothetical protein NDU88_006720 [Pleurodeles waltl]|uniref:Uncharacterized protein n=1 Tax=Pleurodeles waltl TaxID=8319 RepID=A0AAV7N008_PLEWA|nr:hypothetical protein NDU88_006720 [Pleurodeles waltl]